VEVSGVVGQLREVEEGGEEELDEVAEEDVVEDGEEDVDGGLIGRKSLAQ
jgi:hypothetical protein